MGITSCTKLTSGTKLTLDEFGRATVTEVYLVVTDSTIFTGPSSSGYGPYSVMIDACSAAAPLSVPKLLTQYNDDHGSPAITGTTDNCAWLLKKEIARAPDDEGNRTCWHITCTWGPLPFGYSGFGTGTGATPLIPSVSDSKWLADGKSPLLDPVIERSEYENYRSLAEYDINGSAIVNSAGDQLVVHKDDSRPVFVFIKNMWPEDVIDAKIAQYKNATNSDTFKGHAPYTLKMAGIKKGLLQERNGVAFFPVTFRIHKAEVAIGSLGTNDTWRIVRADRGGQHLEMYNTGTGTGLTTNSRKVWPTVSSGTSSGEFLDVVNLNPDGTRKADGLDPGTKTFDVYYPLPFSGLGL